MYCTIIKLIITNYASQFAFWCKPVFLGQGIDPHSSGVEGFKASSFNVKVL